MFLAILLFPMISAVRAWQLERPDQPLNFHNRVVDGNNDNNASVSLAVAANGYNTGNVMSDGQPYVDLNVSVLANSRKGITYDWNYLGSNDPNFNWVDASQLNSPVTKTTGGGNLSDTIWPADIPSPDGLCVFDFQFYGGCDSGQYNKTYVSTNGFVSLDNRSTASPSPMALPNSAAPPAMIAAVWTHLYMDSLSSITWGIYPGYHASFVIIWNNMLTWGDNVRLTFEIQLVGAYQDLGDYDKHWAQSIIYIRYKQYQVSAISSDWGWGIQDQYGYNGIGYIQAGYDLGYRGGETIKFFQNSRYNCWLKSFTLTFSDVNPHAYMRDYTNLPLQNGTTLVGYFLRGYHIVPNYGIPTSWADTIQFTLFALSAGIGVMTAQSYEGLLLSVGLQTTPVAIDYISSVQALSTQQYSGRQIDISQNETDNLIATASACSPACVDATMDIFPWWILNDSSPYENHTLNVTATLVYSVYDRTTGALIDAPPISTTATIQMNPDNNNTPSTASTIAGGATYDWLWIGGYDTADYYQINVPSGDTIEIIQSDMSVTTALNTYMSLIDPNGGHVWSDTYNSSHYMEYSVATAGEWQILVTPETGSWGFYTLTVNLYSPPGGCPYVSTWNGSQYVLDNNLLSKSEFTSGRDITDSYVLQQKLMQGQNGTCSLLLSEFENEHDYIDQIQLLAVDHASDVNVCASPEGEILTYTRPFAPVSAMTDEHQNAKRLLSGVDGSYYEAHNGSYVTLNFGDLNVRQGAKLVLRTDNMYRPIKDPIYIQVQQAKGVWNTVATVIPRINYSTDIVDMSKFLPDAEGNLKVRLCFTADHKVDFVELDTSPQARLGVHTGQLVSAINSAAEDVTAKLLNADQSYAELVPGENIRLAFTLPKQTTEARTYIVMARGHYCTIP